jgi:hypothetical protein
MQGLRLWLSRAQRQASRALAGYPEVVAGERDRRV